MFLAIDNRPLIRQPHTIAVRFQEAQLQFSADRRPLATPAPWHATIECQWGGGNASHSDVLRELDRLRANEGIHAVTFETLRHADQRITLNCFMGKPSYDMIRQLKTAKHAVAAFTIPFIQVDTVVGLFPLTWRCMGILAVMNGFRFQYPPAAGRIVAVDGFIGDLGAGAGQTSIQLRNVTQTKNYLSTEGDFVCAPPDREMQNHVLATDLDFNGQDEIACDITDIPGGGLSKNANITAWTLMFQP